MLGDVTLGESIFENPDCEGSEEGVTLREGEKSMARSLSSDKSDLWDAQSLGSDINIIDKISDIQNSAPDTVDHIEEIARLQALIANLQEAKQRAAVVNTTTPEQTDHVTPQDTKTGDGDPVSDCPSQEYNGEDDNQMEIDADTSHAQLQ